jgi:hypothetical protein
MTPTLFKQKIEGYGSVSPKWRATTIRSRMSTCKSLFMPVSRFQFDETLEKLTHVLEGSEKELLKLGDSSPRWGVLTEVIETVQKTAAFCLVIILKLNIFIL